jgi:hypothetical protein
MLMPSPSPAFLAGAAPDPHWSWWRDTWEGVRRPVALGLTSVAVVNGVGVVADRIVNSHDPMRGRGAADVDHPYPGWSAEALPQAGTATYGFHAAPPHGVIDPERPEPMVLRVRGVNGWPRE